MYLNPEMYESMKKMMNPEMMKNMTSMIQNMSDDDLRRIGGMSGQNMSPEMMRMAANQMKNMKNEDIENLKNQQTVSFYFIRIYQTQIQITHPILIRQSLLLIKLLLRQKRSQVSLCRRKH